jgi:pyrroloquinoline quinone biosynthesis protein D
MKPTLTRNPDVVSREEPRGRQRALEQGQADAPCLTLVHLGTMFQLNLVGAEIWKRCDGTRGEAEIVAELEELFDADPGELARDVSAFVRDLVARKWLQWS